MHGMKLAPERKRYLRPEIQEPFRGTIVCDLLPSIARCRTATMFEGGWIVVGAFPRGHLDDLKVVEVQPHPPQA